MELVTSLFQYVMGIRATNKGIRGVERSGFSSSSFCLGVSFAFVIFFVTGFLLRSIFRMEKMISQLSGERSGLALLHVQDEIKPPVLASPVPEKTCQFPLVYNKPHKTGSTKIRDDIAAWARREHRHIFQCSAYINQATFQMRECISTDRSGCAIVATHIVMSPVMREILEAKIGKYKLVTSTRDPKQRILSSFLQMGRLKATSATNSTDLNQYLRSYNPWKLYNYHTGENRVAKCPMKEGEYILLHDMVNRADVVIDVDLFNVSQTILKYEKLFPLTESVANVRSSSALVLEPETERLLSQATCVEDKIHKLYRIRMASAYQKATGKSCLSNSREATDCFDEMK